MAKKSTRVLSFILSALLLVTMLPVISLAEDAKYYTFDEGATTKDYYNKLDYTTLVGPENQNDSRVFVINKSWKYKEENAPKSVSFTFRNETVSEKYDASRHKESLAAAIKDVKANGIKKPHLYFDRGCL